MSKVTEPAAINPAFAEAYNRRDIAAMLDLFEEDAVLRVDAETTFRGKAALAAAFAGEFARMPGRMVSTNRYCLTCGGIALLRAEFTVVDDAGAVLAAGSTAEVARRQPDGTWRYVIDHAAGAGPSA